MASEGDTVRPYNVPSYTYDVLETGVERDTDIEGAERVIRVPNGDTLLRRTGRDGAYAVLPERLLNETT